MSQPNKRQKVDFEVWKTLFDDYEPSATEENVEERKDASLPKDNTVPRAIIEKIQRDKRHVFLRGAAGTGKSIALKQVRRILQEDYPEVPFAVVAHTGIAAVNVEGRTLLSYLGLGLFQNTLEEYLEPGGIPSKVRDRLRKIRILIIDEISTVDGKMFAKLGRLMGVVCGNRRPFGHATLLMVGDMLQLAPIRNNRNRWKGSKKGQPTTDDKFMFQTKLWHEMNVFTIELTKIWRQYEKNFLRVLEEARFGKFTDTGRQLLESRVSIAPPKEPFVRICNYRKDVSQFNKEALDKLPGPEITKTGILQVAAVERRGVAYVTKSGGGTTKVITKITSISKNDRKRVQKIVNNHSMFPNDLNNFPVPFELKLKPGAKVLLRKNMPEHELVSNTFGFVTYIDENTVTVDFAGKGIVLEQVTFVQQKTETAALQLLQFPLMLGASLTTHKCQGQSLERTYIDTNAFACGQAYVALSRVRSLDGLFLSSFNEKCFRADPAAVEFVRQPADLSFPLQH